MPDLFDSVASSKANGSADSYSAKDIEVLEGLEPVRRRPGMYVGGTDERALHHLAAEALDNAMDEAVAGFATRIELELGAGGWVTVRDNGRGIPVDPHPRFPKKSALEIILTMLHSGGKFGGDAYKTSGGLHGVGVSVTNALSSRLDVTVWRDGRVHTIGFADGDVRTPLASRAARAGYPASGTRVTVWPNRKYFDTVQVPSDELERLLRSKAMLLPGAGVSLTFERDGRRLEWRYEGGLSQYL